MKLQNINSPGDLFVALSLFPLILTGPFAIIALIVVCAIADGIDWIFFHTLRVVKG